LSNSWPEFFPGVDMLAGFGMEMFAPLECYAVSFADNYVFFQQPQVSKQPSLQD
jgi:hypothetical protein